MWRLIGVIDAPERVEEGLSGSGVVDGATMEILLVTTELSPWVSSTETPDEIFALARAFRQLGHDVTVLAPFDNAFEHGGLLVARRLTPIALADGRAVTIFDAQLSSGAKMVLLGMPAGADARLMSADMPEAASLGAATTFANVVAAFVAQRIEQGQPFDVVHLFDWTASLVGLSMRRILHSGAPTIVLSVHDPRRTGSVDKRIAASLDNDLLRHESLERGEQLSLLRAGIVAADAVVVPSESHTDLLRQSADSMGLAAVYANQAKPVFAVQAGVDYARVNPATNPSLLARYDAEDASAKVATKMAVLRELGLSLDNRPFVLFPGPMTVDGGGDLIVDAIDAILEQPLSLCVWSMANDSPDLVAELNKRIVGRSTAAVHRVCKSEEDTHRGFAAADFVLCPTRHSAGRVPHLTAQRYGAIVIALSSPGLRDVIVDCDAALETGTGFLFEETSGTALAGALMRANAAYNQPGFSKLRRRVMRQDSSWERPARRMLQIYKKAHGAKSREPSVETAY